MTATRRFQHEWSVFAAAVIAFGLLAAPSAGQCRYELTVIEGPPCPPFGLPTVSRPRDIDERGQVVGRYRKCDLTGNRPFRWTATEGFVELEHPPFEHGEAQALNGRGEIVGLVMRSPSRGAHWRDGEMLVLEGPPEATWTEAEAIDADGVIAGWWGNTLEGPSPVAALWEDGEFVDLGPVVGGVQSKPIDINRAGDIAGTRRIRDGDEWTAFLLRDGEVIDVPPIPGAVASEARAMNERGDVVGEWESDRGPTEERAFLWSGDDVVALPNLPGASECRAWDVNDRCEVVGTCLRSRTAVALPSGGLVAVIWRDGVPAALDELRDEARVGLKSALAINNAGQIAGQTDGNDTFVLTPRPVVPGDVTCDWSVGEADLLQVLTRWGPCGLCPADLDRDRVVGAADLAVVLGNWTR